MTESASTPLLNMALDMYAGEPCRICGRTLTRQDIRGKGAVFAGYSADNKSRAAHRDCFDGFEEMCEQLGLDWRAAMAQMLRGPR